MRPKHFHNFFLIFSSILLFAVIANAQFNSGSTGADGALDLSTMTCPANTCEVQLPESGILNYTTLNIPSSKALVFRKNTRNTPVTILAQGNVVVNGTISVSAPDNSSNSGPGGFNGGWETGFGPGGGTSSNFNGRWVGPLSLVPITGGSGGSQGGGVFTGGGGGGAIVIASSATISATNTGRMYAIGSVICGSFCGGAGSGGAIRLVANVINFAGIFNASNGVVRLEAQPGQLSFTGQSTPAAVLSTVNSTVVPSDPPSLTLSSIGGFAVPSYSGTRTDTVDLLLPTQLTDPINVVIQGRYVPVGTQVRLQFSGSNATTAPCTLAGTDANSTCTCTISSLNRTAVTYILAVATFNPPALAEVFNPRGQNHIAKVRLETALGGKQKYIFLRADGTQVEIKNLPTQFLLQFGM